MNHLADAACSKQLLFRLFTLLVCAFIFACDEHHLCPEYLEIPDQPEHLCVTGAGEEVRVDPCAPSGTVFPRRAQRNRAAVLLVLGQFHLYLVDLRVHVLQVGDGVFHLLTQRDAVGQGFSVHPFQGQGQDQPGIDSAALHTVHDLHEPGGTGKDGSKLARLHALLESRGGKGEVPDPLVGQEGVELLFVLKILFRLALFDTVKGWLGDIQKAALHQPWHFPVKER